MKILGAKIIPVTKGLKTLKEAVDSAFESYLKDTKNSNVCNRKCCWVLIHFQKWLEIFKVLLVLNQRAIF